MASGSKDPVLVRPGEAPAGTGQAAEPDRPGGGEIEPGRPGPQQPGPQEGPAGQVRPARPDPPGDDMPQHQGHQDERDGDVDPQPRPAGDRAHQPGGVAQAGHERDDDQRREQQRNPPGGAAAAQAAADHPALPRDEQQDHQPGDAMGDGRPPPAGRSDRDRGHAGPEDQHQGDEELLVGDPPRGRPQDLAEPGHASSPTSSASTSTPRPAGPNSPAAPGTPTPPPHADSLLGGADGSANRFSTGANRSRSIGCNAWQSNSRTSASPFATSKQRSPFLQAHVRPRFQRHHRDARRGAEEVLTADRPN